MTTNLIIIIAYSILILWVILSIVVWSIRNGISPMPTVRKTKRKLLKMVPYDIHGTIYELGSGWGTLALPLAKDHPYQKVVGYETSTFPYWISRILTFVYAYKNLAIVKKDFFDVPLNDAGLIVCYLYPEAMRKLKTKFEAELKPGTWVLSNTFAIPGWEPVEVIEVDDLYKTKIYLYQK